MDRLFEIAGVFAMWSWPLLLLVIINFLAFAAFGWDKRAARLNNQRVPEAKLLLLVLIGGCVGAVVGQKYFRHKTKKQPFRTQMFAIIILQIAVLLALGMYLFGNF